MSESHFSNRLSFVVLLTGFLLSLLFQVSLTSRDGLSPEKIRILDFMVFFLLIIVYCFLFSFVFLLMASTAMALKSEGLTELSEEEKKALSEEEEKRKGFIRSCLNKGSNLAILGLYCFSILFYLILQWNYINDPATPIISALVYLFILYIIYAGMNWKWMANDPKSREDILNDIRVFSLIIVVLTVLMFIFRAIIIY